MLKRLFDLVLAIILLLFFSPLFIIVIIILSITGEGEIFYKQERVGYKNKKFNIIKFATMYKNSELIGDKDILSKICSGIFFTVLDNKKMSHGICMFGKKL